jgi:hypothetical protein
VTGDNVPLEALIPTFHFDYQLVVEMQGTLESFEALPADVCYSAQAKAPLF